MEDRTATGGPEQGELPNPPPGEASPPPPGRAARGPDEGPARDGGSGLTAEDEAAEDEVGGGT